MGVTHAKEGSIVSRESKVGSTVSKEGSVSKERSISPKEGSIVSKVGSTVSNTSNQPNGANSTGDANQNKSTNTNNTNNAAKAMNTTNSTDVENDPMNAPLYTHVNKPFKDVFTKAIAQAKHQRVLLAAVLSSWFPQVLSASITEYSVQRTLVFEDHLSSIASSLIVIPLANDGATIADTPISMKGDLPTFEPNKTSSYHVSNFSLRPTRISFGECNDSKEGITRPLSYYRSGSGEESTIFLDSMGAEHELLVTLKKGSKIDQEGLEVVTVQKGFDSITQNKKILNHDIHYHENFRRGAGPPVKKRISAVRQPCGSFLVVFYSGRVYWELRDGGGLFNNPPGFCVYNPKSSIITTQLFESASTRARSFNFIISGECIAISDITGIRRVRFSVGHPVGKMNATPTPTTIQVENMLSVCRKEGASYYEYEIHGSVIHRGRLDSPHCRFFGVDDCCDAFLALAHDSDITKTSVFTILRFGIASISIKETEIVKLFAFDFNVSHFNKFALFSKLVLCEL